MKNIQKIEQHQTITVGFFGWLLDKVNSWHDYFIFKQLLTVSEWVLLLASFSCCIWAMIFGVYFLKVSCDSCYSSGNAWAVGIGIASVLHFASLFLNNQWPRMVACGLHGFFWATIFIASLILLPEPLFTPLAFVIFILGSVSFAKMLAAKIRPQNVC